MRISRIIICAMICTVAPFASASDRLLYEKVEGRVGKIYSYDPASGQTTAMYSDEHSQSLSYPLGGWPAFYRASAGGKKVFLLKIYGVKDKPREMCELYELKLDGSNQARKVIDIPEANFAVRPSVSLDGQKIIYEGWDLVDGIQQFYIYLRRTDNGQLESKVAVDDFVSGHRCKVDPNGRAGWLQLSNRMYLNAICEIDIAYVEEPEPDNSKHILFLEGLKNVSDVGKAHGMILGAAPDDRLIFYKLFGTEISLAKPPYDEKAKHTEIKITSGNSIIDPVVSDSGDYLAFSNQKEIHILDLRTGKETSVVSTLLPQASIVGWIQN